MPDFDMDGGVVLSSPSLDFSVTLSFLLESSWDIEGEVSLSFSSSWNTGETALQWYRIEGECTSATCETLGVNPNDGKCGTGTPDGAKFLTTVAARGLTDLCQKLKDPALFPPVVTKIQSIKKYSRPVQKQEKTIILGSNGLAVQSSGPDPNPECNVLIEQPITTCIEEIAFPSSLQTTQTGFYMQVFVGAYEFEMTGGINTGGEATYAAPNYIFDMTGGIVISGEAELDFWYGTISGGEATAELSVLDMTVLFAEVDSQDTLSIDDGTVTVDCGCGPLPLTLILRHNLTKANYLSNFFKRNNITFEDIITLRYNSNTTSWRGHLHFVGDGNYNTRERWNMFFEWACTDSSGADTWRLYVFINRKDLATGEDSETRVSFTIPTNFACTDKRIHFKSEVDTRNGLVTLRKGFADDILFNDSIGLFKNRLWAARPLLTFEINQNDQQGTLQRYDLKPIFPVEELNLEN
jgi:hypothetical protein